MSYNQGDNRKNNYRGGGQNGVRYNEPAPLPTAEPLPANYVDIAESVMKDKNSITTSKIRNILSMVSDIYNDEYTRTDKAELLPESQNALQLLRIRIIYEAGRNQNDVKPFIIKAKLVNYLLDIGSDREKFIRYAHYLEALVAYHRYFGGKD